MKKTFLGILAILVILCSFIPSQASLITNGTFDNDLSGWIIDPATTTGVTWGAGSATARVGNPGSPGIAIFSQSFYIPAGTDALNISFDYMWMPSQPVNVDTFSAQISYETISGTTTEVLLSQGSDVASFGVFSYYGDVLLLSNIDTSISQNATISFIHNEVNPSNHGSRVHLDNVIVSTVPIPGALWLFLPGFIGLSVTRVKIK